MQWTYATRSSEASDRTDIGLGPLIPLDILLLIIDEFDLDNDPCLLSHTIFSNYVGDISFAPLVWHESKHF